MTGSKARYLSGLRFCRRAISHNHRQLAPAPRSRGLFSRIYGSSANFVGIKGYEAYAGRAAGATAVLAAAMGDQSSKPKTPGYHASNLMIGTPEEVIKRMIDAQKACSFSEITIVPQFGTMPYDEVEKSTKLFAKEVLPVIHKTEAPLQPSVLPPAAVP